MVRTDIQIRFSDIDGVGHVNNASILEYYDLGLSNYFKTVDIINGAALSGDIVVKVNINMNFIDSIVINDNIEVTTAVSKIGNRSITLYQEIVEKGSGVVKSNCTTVMAGLNKESMKGAEISEEWKLKIKNHENFN